MKIKQKVSTVKHTFGLLPASFLAVRNDGALCEVDDERLRCVAAASLPTITTCRHCEGVAQSNPLRFVIYRNETLFILILSIFLLFSVIIYGQQPSQVSIFQPLNGAFFDGSQVKVEFIVSGTEPNFARILLNDNPVQLLKEVKLGQNSVIVDDISGHDCKISIIAVNSYGESVPAVVNLKRNEHVFKPTLYLLAIGVSKYSDKNLQLKFAAKDAIDFSLSMVNQQGLLYEKVELRLLTDEQANAEKIRDGLQWLQTETTFSDIAMLYMAGHGVNDNVGDFFFLPVNADINRLNATCVGYREIKETISAIAGKTIAFMDACHSGNILGDNQRRAALLEQAINDLTSADNGAVVFTSSTGRQFSLENSEWNNGAFTKALVEGLNGAADLFDRQTITVNTLASYVANRVKELTNGQQAPTTIIPSSVPDFPVAVTVNVTVNVILPTSPSETANTNRNSNENNALSGTNTVENRRNGAAYNPDGIELIYVEGNGAVKGFYIGKYEVTQAQWKALMGGNPSNFKGDNLPVENVSWNDAREFLQRLNEKTGKRYRLPTEAEWEFAAREGAKQSDYNYSGSNEINNVGWYRGNNANRTQPVGSKQPNELGIYDMTGNVWEWCEDLWNAPLFTFRVARGGSWNDIARLSRVNYRGHEEPGTRDDYTGFRIVLP
jgi:hypothetical protein